MTVMVQAEGLHKSFGEVHALRGIDLRVDAGEILGVLGPNGAGKTTMIGVLTTLVESDEGTARIDDIDVREDPSAVRARIGLTGQYAAVDEGLTGRENLVLFGRLLKLGSAGAKARAEELLAEFELSDAADRRTSTYSGGMRRRLDLAASVIARPKVLFLDEPTTGLDPRSRNTLWAAVRRLRDEGTTVLLTTQYLAEADELADRIAVIDQGTVIANGTPDELKRRVGGSVCHIELTDTDTADHAENILGARWKVTRSPGSLTVPADGAQTLVDVVRTLDEHQISPHDIGLRHPTLDDVFLALTGHEASHDEEQGQQYAS